LEPYLFPELEIVVDDSLGFTVKGFGAYLVEDHPLYLKYLPTMRNVTVSSLVKDLENYKVCAGVQDAATELTSKLYHHVVLIEDSLEDGEDNQQFPNKGYWRSKGCWLACNQDASVCNSCSEFLVYAGNAMKAKESRQLKPAHANTPVSKTNPVRLKLTLHAQRLRCAELEKELNEMREELRKSNIEVDHELSRT